MLGVVIFMALFISCDKHNQQKSDIDMSKLVVRIAEIEVYGCERGDQVPPISEESRSIRAEESPKNNADSEIIPVNQQVPGIPGKPVIKFVN